MFRGIYTRDEARTLTEHYVGGADRDRRTQARRRGGDPTAEDSVSRLELTRYMRNQLLRDSDVMSMASGVELRVPFLDSVLFEHAVAAARAISGCSPARRCCCRPFPKFRSGSPTGRSADSLLPIEQWLDARLGRHEFAQPDRAGRRPDGHLVSQVVGARLRAWLQRLTPQHV